MGNSTHWTLVPVQLTVSSVTLDSIFGSQFNSSNTFQEKQQLHYEDLFCVQTSVVLRYIIPTSMLADEESFFSQGFKREILETEKFSSP